MKRLSLASCLISLALFGCDRGSDDFEELSLTADAKGLVCTNSRVTYKPDGAQTVNWVSVRNANERIAGTIPVDGTFTTSKTLNLTANTVELTFDINRLYSADDLRDFRVKKFLFGFYDNFLTRFTVASMAPVAGKAGFYTANGVLEIHGISSALSVPLRIETTKNLMRLTSGPGSIRLGMRNQLRLDKQLDELLGLIVPTTIDDQVELSFDILLTNKC